MDLQNNAAILVEEEQDHLRSYVSKSLLLIFSLSHVCSLFGGFIFNFVGPLYPLFQTSIDSGRGF